MSILLCDYLDIDVIKRTLKASKVAPDNSAETRKTACCVCPRKMVMSCLAQLSSNRKQ